MKRASRTILSDDDICYHQAETCIESTAPQGRSLSLIDGYFGAGGIDYSSVIRAHTAFALKTYNSWERGRQPVEEIHDEDGDWCSGCGSYHEADTAFNPQSSLHHPSQSYGLFQQCREIHPSISPTTTSHSLPFCTQPCLLGLTGLKTFKLDPACPNYAHHRQGVETDHHLVGPTDLKRHLAHHRNNGQQISISKLDLNGIAPGKLSANTKNTLYRISILSYGYTFVGKVSDPGQPSALLLNQADMYKRLTHLQGTSIPVYIGRTWFRHDDQNNTKIKSSMLLLSHCGRRVSKVEEARHRFQIREFEKGTLKRARVKCEVNSRNVLRCEKTERLMFVDFERATKRRKKG